MADRRKMTENELHEYVAEIEGHGSQVTGVIGYFYEMYRREVIARVTGTPNREILEVGCGEGMLFDGTDIVPVQMDVSIRRVRFARDKGQPAICGDGYQIPFANRTFSLVLLIAMLEHTSEPWRVLAEARRVLKPGGRAIIVVPNDFTLSAGRLMLGKFPVRYPDHLTFTTPGRMHRWLANGFRVVEEFPLPFRPLPYAVNLYYFMVVEAI
jgi:SAM-dependent methyltransferase